MPKNRTFIAAQWGILRNTKNQSLYPYCARHIAKIDTQNYVKIDSQIHTEMVFEPTIFLFFNFSLKASLIS